MERNKDFYATKWKYIEGLFGGIKQHFKSKRNGFIEPLEFMHLLDEKYEYINNNIKKPFSTVNQLNNSFKSEIEKHIVYRFILKAYNVTYPIYLHDSLQISPILKFIEIEFLSFEEDTPEKLDYLNGSTSYVSESKAQNYKFSKKDFKNLSFEYDFDFFYECEKLKESMEWLPYKLIQINAVFKTVWHFERGERKGLIEPLAFLNIIYQYYKLLIKNPESRYSTIDLIRELPIDKEVKHILWGFILLWVREYENTYKDIEYQFDKDVLSEIVGEFLNFEEYTPEMKMLKYPSKQFREVLENVIISHNNNLSDRIRFIAGWYLRAEDRFKILRKNQLFYAEKNGFTNSDDFKEFIDFIEMYVEFEMNKNLLNHDLTDFDYVMYLQYKNLVDTQNYSKRVAQKVVWQKFDNRNPITAFEKMVVSAKSLCFSYIHIFVIKSLQITYGSSFQTDDSRNEYLLKQADKIPIRLIEEEIVELEEFMINCKKNYRLKDAIENKFSPVDRDKYEYLKISNDYYKNQVVEECYAVDCSVKTTYAKYFLFYDWLKELKNKQTQPQQNEAAKSPKIEGNEKKKTPAEAPTYIQELFKLYSDYLNTKKCSERKIIGQITIKILNNDYKEIRKNYKTENLKNMGDSIRRDLQDYGFIEKKATKSDK